MVVIVNQGFHFRDRGKDLGDLIVRGIDVPKRLVYVNEIRNDKSASSYHLQLGRKTRLFHGGVFVELEFVQKCDDEKLYASFFLCGNKRFTWEMRNYS